MIYIPKENRNLTLFKEFYPSSYELLSNLYLTAWQCYVQDEKGFCDTQGEISLCSSCSLLMDENIFINIHYLIEYDYILPLSTGTGLNYTGKHGFLYVKLLDWQIVNDE
jgi:hypothetical protein